MAVAASSPLLHGRDARQVVEQVELRDGDVVSATDPASPSAAAWRPAGRFLRAAGRGCSRDRCSWKRARHLAIFFFLNFVMCLSDNVTDFLGGWSLYRRGDCGWAAATWALPFAPWAVNVAIAAFTKVSRGLWKEFGGEVLLSLKHLPFVQPIVNLYLFGKLLGLETEESWTHRRKEEIQVSALGLSFSEAFLEAGPQFILQVSIVLRLGYVSPVQVISLPVSWVTLSLSASRGYYFQRLEPFSDPDPPWRNLLVVFFFFMFSSLAYGLSWAFALAYFQKFVFVPIFIMFCVMWLSFKIYRLDEKLRKLNRMNEGDEREEPNEARKAPSGDNDPAMLKWKGVLTSVLMPCVVGHHETTMLLISSLSTVACHLTCIWSLLLAGHFLSDEQAGEQQPITSCLEQRSSSNLEYGDGDFTWMWICHSDCVALTRLCDPGEAKLDVLLDVCVILSLLVLGSVPAYSLLQWASDYGVMFRQTNRCGGKGFLHRSLLESLVKEGDHENLEAILEDLTTSRRKEVSRQNSKGDTPLHIACRKGDEVSVRLLLSHSAKIIENDLRQTPGHLAAACGSVACNQLILPHMDEMIDRKDLSGRTMLDYAVEKNFSSVAKCILLGSHANGGSTEGSSALHIACACGTLSQLKTVLDAQPGRQERNRSDGNSDGRGVRGGTRSRRWLEYCCEGQKNRTPFHHAAERKDLGCLVMLLQYLREDLPERHLPEDADGENPFDLAAKAKRAHNCKAIIDYLSGRHLPSPSDKAEDYVDYDNDDDGPFPGSFLAYALGINSLECCKMVARTIRKHPWYKLGRMSKGSHGEHDYASVAEHRVSRESVLFMALKKKDVAYLDFFLGHIEEVSGRDALRRQLDSEEDPERFVLIQRAAQAGKAEFVRSLLDHGASPHLIGRAGEEPLALSALGLSRPALGAEEKAGLGRTVMLLRAAGADPRQAVERHSKHHCGQGGENCEHFSSSARGVLFGVGTPPAEGKNP